MDELKILFVAYGKIKDCMPSVKNDVKYDPPRMIPSIVGGFNAVASHIYIILFPMCLDLLLWLGPLVRVKNYFLPLLVEAANVSSAASAVIVIFAGYKDMMEQTIFKYQPGLKSRCTWRFEIDGYTEKGLAEIF